MHALLSTRPLLLTPALSLVATLVTATAMATDVPADPSDYLQKFDTLAPGDKLVLAAGDYLGGLRIDGKNGTPGQPIVVEGPGGGDPARFVGRGCCNTIDIESSSYITLRSLLLDGNGEYVDAIKAGGAASSWTHHITIEGCNIINHDVGQTAQQAVGISTKIVSWDWVIRGNVIGDPNGVGTSAGTGLYLGNSDGTAAFIGGLIEGNLVLDTLGYNMEIKHQLAREQAPGVPAEPRAIVIRHNVFIKSNNPSPSGPRPNVLVSGFPDSGPGSADWVEIYGNFFFHNDEDALLQGAGRVHIHDNLFVDSQHAAIHLMNHHGKSVIDGLLYNNTIYDTATGISFSSAPTGLDWVVANAIFSPQPMSGVGGAADNITDTVANAGQYVNAPSKTLGGMDFYPVVGSALSASAFDLSAAASDADWDRDFNGDAKDFSYRGAYSGEGQNPGWSPDAEPKPLPQGSSSGGGGGGAGGGASSSSGSGGGASSSSGSGGGSSSGGPPPGAPADDSGCGCHAAPASDGNGPWAGLLAALALALGSRRRRRQRSAQQA